jgi:amino acid transporter
MKIKVLLLFLLLGVTPFIRGCGETFGFPLPAMNDIIEPGALSTTWDHLLAALASPQTMALIVVNIIFAVFFARIFSRNAVRFRWMPHVMTMLTIGLVMIWVMTALFILDVEMDNPKTLPEKAANRYNKVFMTIYYTAPLTACRNIVDAYPWGVKDAERFIKKDNVEYLLDDVFNRAWFVMVTFAGGFLLYGVSAAAGALRRKRRA